MKNIKLILAVLLVFCSTAFLFAQSDSILSGDNIIIVDTIHNAQADTSNKESQQEEKGILHDIQENVPGKPKDVLDVISIPKIFWSIVIIIIGYYFIKIVISLLVLVAERSAKLRILIKGFIPVFRMVMWAIIIFAIIKGIFNPPFETVLAFTASVGIALGLAAQDVLKNVFGGIAIIIDQPFKVGDKIEAGSHYGEVLEIGLRSTRIVTPDDSVVSIPNNELVNNSVSNSNSGELNCQVVAEIYLPIDIDTQKVRKIAIESAQVSRYVYLKKPIAVIFLNEVKEQRSYLKMRLKAYVMDIRYEFAFKSDMTEIVLRELFKENLINKEDLQ
jgi:small-conductance mechanosensitive channel